MRAPKSIEFHCPGCLYRLAVSRSDRTAVRRVGSTGHRVWLIRVICPGCGREIVRSALAEGKK